MNDISNAMAALKEDFEASDKLVNDIYMSYFKKYFGHVDGMYEKFQDTDVPITDKELEWIITSLPLDLFAASNALAQFKSHNEIVKLTIKSRKGDSPEGIDAEYKLMSIIYSSVISLVELKISFSKELIMGAKKVWDARRTSEIAPINETSTLKIPELPDYQLDSDNERPKF